MIFYHTFVLQRRRPDPFKLPKAAEKTGFSASQIKVCNLKILSQSWFLTLITTGNTASNGNKFPLCITLKCP